MHRHLTGKVTEVITSPEPVQNNATGPLSFQVASLETGDETSFTLEVQPGFLRAGDIVTVTLDYRKRLIFCKNHTNNSNWQSPYTYELFNKIVMGTIVFIGLLAIPSLLYGLSSFVVPTENGFISLVIGLAPIAAFFIYWKLFSMSMENQRKKNLRDADDEGSKYQAAIDTSIERRRAAIEAI